MSQSVSHASLAPAIKAPKREKKNAEKNDPRLVAAARELRDRWMQRVNADRSFLPSVGNYDVSKELIAPVTVERIAALRSLPAPMAA